MSASSDERRLARMRSAWRAAAPDAQGVAKAYQRFVKQQSEHRSRHWSFELLLAAAVAGGAIVLFGRGGVMGSDGFVGFGGGSKEASSVATLSSPGALPAGSAPSLAAAPAGLWIERSGALVPATPGIQYSVAEGESVNVIVEGERHAVIGPTLFEVMLEVDRASGFRVYQSDVDAPRERGAQSAVESKRQPEPSASPQTTALGAQLPVPLEVRQQSAASDGWVRAAAAMRTGDTLGAERELQALSRSASAETRDAAELTLAQLWLTQGKGTRARPALSRLSREGATARIQRRASELLNGSGSSGAFPPP